MSADHLIHQHESTALERLVSADCNPYRVAPFFTGCPRVDRVAINPRLNDSIPTGIVR